MRTQFTSSRVLTILALSLTAVLLMSAAGEAGPPGLNYDARQYCRVPSSTSISENSQPPKAPSTPITSPTIVVHQG